MKLPYLDDVLIDSKNERVESKSRHRLLAKVIKLKLSIQVIKWVCKNIYVIANEVKQYQTLATASLRDASRTLHSQ